MLLLLVWFRWLGKLALSGGRGKIITFLYKFVVGSKPNHSLETLEHLEQAPFCFVCGEWSHLGSLLKDVKETARMAYRTNLHQARPVLFTFEDNIKILLNLDYVANMKFKWPKFLIYRYMSLLFLYGDMIHKGMCERCFSHIKTPQNFGLVRILHRSMQCWCN